MNKLYALAPLAGLLLFGGYHWKYSRQHAARMAEIQHRSALEQQQKRAKEEADRTKALAEAERIVAQRKQERAEKEQREAEQKQVQLALEQRRNAAHEQAHRLRPQVDRLRTDVAIAAAALARAEERKTELRQERAFLVDYVRQAEANRNAFHYLLEKLEAIERNRASAIPRTATSESRADES